MDVSIVIVNWNVRDLLTKCLETIFEHTKNVDFEIIVVDNASKDGSVQHLRDSFPEPIKQGKLLIIENHGNYGFAKANNQGLKEAGGEFVLFMNPDMELIENTILKLKDFMIANVDIDMSTCTLLYGDKTIQPNIKADPKLFGQLLILLKLHHLFKNSGSLKKYFAKDFDYQSQSEVKQIMGAFVFTRRTVINDLEGWDEDFWLWWEDHDLCKRATHKNYHIVYTPISQVIHYEGKSFEQVVSLTKQKRFIKAMLTYFKKHHSLLAYTAIMLVSPLSLFLAYITQTLKIKPKTQSRV